MRAGEIVGRLYKSLAAQYRNIDTDPVEQRSLNVLIVRFVFLLYAEDAGLLQEHQAFLNYMRNVEPEGMRLALMQLFEVLDTPEDQRDPYLSERLAAFPYINGSLFAKADIVIPQFTAQIKYDLLKEASQDFDWSGISPTIFGAAFESTLNPETRRMKLVEIEDARMASEVTELLMGTEVPPRKTFIYNHAVDAELDI